MPPNGRPHAANSHPSLDATKDDILAVSLFGAFLFAAIFAHSIPPEIRISSWLMHTALNALLENSESAGDVIVALDEQSGVVAFAHFTCNTFEPCLPGKENLCKFLRLYTHSSHHGKGIRSSIIRKIDEMARAQGFSGIWIGV